MEEIQIAPRSLIENISFYFLFILTFLVPVFFVPSSFISTQFGTSLLFAYGVIATFLFCLVSRLFSGQVEALQFTKQSLGLFLLVPIVYFLAGIANGFSRMAFLGYMFDLSTVGFIFLAFVYLFLVSILFRDKKRILYSHGIFLISSIIYALFLLIRIVFGTKLLSFGVFDSLTNTPVGTWNNLGIFFSISTILSLFSLEILPVRKIMKAFVLIALIASLFFLVLVNFQFIWILLASVAFLFIVYSIVSKRARMQDISSSTSFISQFQNIPRYFLIVCILSLVFVFWGSVFAPHIENVFKINNVEVRPSLSVTLDIARHTIQTHPLFGSGPNTFVTQWLSYKPDNVTSTVFWNTDFAYGIGLIPTFAVTTGVFGVISWLIFFGFYLYLGWKSLFTKIEDVFVKYAITSSFFASFFLWCMAWVYVPSTVIFILTFFFTGLFLASAGLMGLLPLNRQVFSKEPKIAFIWSLSLVALLIVVLALGYGLYGNSKSLWYFQKSSYALNTSGNVSDSEKMMKQAIAIVPFDTYYRALSEIQTAKLTKVVSQDPKKINAEELQKQVKDTLSDAISAGLSAKDADPSNYLNWVSLGKVYETATPLKIQGAYESAQFAYTEALRRNPKNPGILMLFALLEVDHGNLPQARSYVLQAIQNKSNYLDAYYLLSQIEVANKNVSGAIDSVTAASILSPNDPTIFFQLGLLKFNAQDFNGAVQALEHSLTLSSQYANAKYYLGLSYEVTGQHSKAIAEFQDLKATNPDNKEVDAILNALLSGKPLFANQQNTKPGKSSLPVKEKQ